MSSTNINGLPMAQSRRKGPSSFPTHEELLNPTLRAFHKLGGSATIDELVNQVIEDLRPSEEVIRAPHGNSGRTKLEYRLAWARTHLKDAGLINNSERGVWALTPKGSETPEINAREVVKGLRQMYQERRRESVSPTPEQPGQARVIVETEQETASWRDRLIDTLLTMSPPAFERLCQRLLRESGFIEVEITGRSGDGGIDGYGIIRVAGLISFPVLFQCKRYKGNIGPGVVRDFRGAMIGRADKGLLITTGGFTRDARLEATRDGAPPIDLISGDLLAEKLRELKLGVSTKMVEAVEIEEQWFKSI